MNNDPVLSARDRTPFATGSSFYRDSEAGASPQAPRIFVRVRPYPLLTPVRAVLDTAAPWCILRPQIGDLIAGELEATSGTVKLSSRLGVVEGRLYRGLLTLLAEEGESLDLEVTYFLSPLWRGPNFLGYEGGLDRIRFAIDPRANLFYFGETG